MITKVKQLKEYQSRIKKWVEYMKTCKNNERFEQNPFHHIILEIKYMKEDVDIKQFPYDLLFFPLIHLYTSLTVLEYYPDSLHHTEEIERIYFELEELLANINIYIDYYLYIAKKSKA
ncbi:hypothetical protein [uncultured Marinococcus sp.]|uniref:hypothetical protein n=1 Tax=uncultured Marinococcus sp. TaxID=487012 RepID=UPI002604CBAD|nr:hypothetical protein [uncultured Marinococcus sp.]